MAQRLWLAGESLAEHPDRGRVLNGLRELAIVPPYLIRYRVAGDIVQIVRIKHGAQRA